MYNITDKCFETAVGYGSVILMQHYGLIIMPLEGLSNKRSASGAASTKSISMRFGTSCLICTKNQLKRSVILFDISWVLCFVGAITCIFWNCIIMHYLTMTCIAINSQTRLTYYSITTRIIITKTPILYQKARRHYKTLGKISHGK